MDVGEQEVQRLTSAGQQASLPGVQLPHTPSLLPKIPDLASDRVTARPNSRRWLLAGTVPGNMLEPSQQTLPDVCKFIQNCFHQRGVHYL